MMTKEQIFDAWAREASPWSRWAKPVLFAHLIQDDTVHTTVAAPSTSWAPPSGEKTALVLDLPSKEGVAIGISLAERGYCPVPLYNAIPPPPGASSHDFVTGRSVAAVDLQPITDALIAGAEKLAALHLPKDAPPAFLLDAGRKGDGRKISNNQFDNRSICFTTDFPSANYLTAHGIERVLLVQKSIHHPQDDLAHPLLRWQEAGLKLEIILLDDPAPGPEPFTVRRPKWYAAMFQRMLAASGLHRAQGGGFGAWVENSAAGG